MHFLQNITSIRHVISLGSKVEAATLGRSGMIFNASGAASDGLGALIYHSFEKYSQTFPCVHIGSLRRAVGQGAWLAALVFAAFLPRSAGSFSVIGYVPDYCR